MTTAKAFSYSAIAQTSQINRSETEVKKNKTAYSVESYGSKMDATEHRPGNCKIEQMKIVNGLFPDLHMYS